MLRSADTQRGASGDPAANGQDSGGEHIVADSQAAAADSLDARGIICNSPFRRRALGVE